MNRPVDIAKAAELRKDMQEALEKSKYAEQGYHVRISERYGTGCYVRPDTTTSPRIYYVPDRHEIQESAPPTDLHRRDPVTAEPGQQHGWVFGVAVGPDQARALLQEDRSSLRLSGEDQNFFGSSEAECRDAKARLVDEFARVHAARSAEEKGQAAERLSQAYLELPDPDLLDGAQRHLVDKTVQSARAHALMATAPADVVRNVRTILDQPEHKHLAALKQLDHKVLDSGKGGLHHEVYAILHREEAQRRFADALRHHAGATQLCRDVQVRLKEGTGHAEDRKAHLSAKDYEQHKSLVAKYGTDLDPLVLRRNTGEHAGHAAADLAIPEAFPGMVKVLDHEGRGRDGFDQVWRDQGGNYVVVECKGFDRERFGSAEVAPGQRAEQVTEKYFHYTCDRIRETSPALANSLQAAAAQGRVSYCSAQPVDKRDAMAGVRVSPATQIGPRHAQRSEVRAAAEALQRKHAENRAQRQVAARAPTPSRS